MDIDWGEGMSYSKVQFACVISVVYSNTSSFIMRSFDKC